MSEGEPDQGFQQVPPALVDDLVSGRRAEGMNDHGIEVGRGEEDLLQVESLRDGPGSGAIREPVNPLKITVRSRPRSRPSRASSRRSPLAWTRRSSTSRLTGDATTGVSLSDADADVVLAQVGDLVVGELGRPSVGLPGGVMRPAPNRTPSSPPHEPSGFPWDCRGAWTIGTWDRF